MLMYVAFVWFLGGWKYVLTHLSDVTFIMFISFPPPLSSRLCIHHLPTKPGSYLANRLLKSPRSTIQSLLLMFKSSYSSWLYVCSWSGFDLCCVGMYTPMTNILQKWLLTLQYTIRDPIVPVKETYLAIRLFNISATPDHLSFSGGSSEYIISLSLSFHLCRSVRHKSGYEFMLNQ